MDQGLAADCYKITGLIAGLRTSAIPPPPPPTATPTSRSGPIPGFLRVISADEVPLHRITPFPSIISSGDSVAFKESPFARNPCHLLLEYAWRQSGGIIAIHAANTIHSLFIAYASALPSSTDPGRSPLRAMFLGGSPSARQYCTCPRGLRVYDGPTRCIRTPGTHSWGSSRESIRRKIRALEQVQADRFRLDPTRIGLPLAYLHQMYRNTLRKSYSTLLSQAIVSTCSPHDVA